MKKKKVLVIGGDSIIGSNFLNLLIKKKIQFIKTTRNNKKYNSKYTIFLNLKNLNKFKQISLNEFSHALISIGITSIKKCERKNSSSYNINVIQMKKIINILIKNKIKIIYLSSDKVFLQNSFLNSTKKTPKPSSVYGRQKVIIENYIRKNTKNYIILRLGKIISKNNELINNWIKSFKTNKEIETFYDEFISPISVNTVSSFLYFLINKRLLGIFHLNSKDSISYYDLALRLAKIKQFDKYLVKSYNSNNKFINSRNMPVLSNKSYEKLGFVAPKSIEVLKSFN